VYITGNIVKSSNKTNKPKRYRDKEKGSLLPQINADQHR
jgi:hypothetical protein